MIPDIKATGKKIATIARVAAIAANVISLAPSMAADNKLFPISL